MLDQRAHAVLDYVTVVTFVLAPTLFGLEGFGAGLAYVLAAVHLVMTLFTRFVGGAVDVLSFDLHSTVELAVGVVLLVGPWLLGSLFETNEQIFYALAGGVILTVWALSGRRTLGGPATAA